MLWEYNVLLGQSPHQRIEFTAAGSCDDDKKPETELVAVSRVACHVIVCTEYTYGFRPLERTPLPQFQCILDHAQRSSYHYILDTTCYEMCVDVARYCSVTMAK